MSNWLDLSSSSNRFIRMYVQGFVDISGGNLIIRNSDISLNGSFYQSTYNGFSMPGLTAIYNYPSLIYTPNDTTTNLISSNVTITAGNSSTTSNTYTLGNSNSMIIGNIYIPRYANVAISANIPMGYDVSMLVQNANLYYANNTYSNIINSPSSTSVYSNLTLLTTSDVVKGNCSYSLNNMSIPIGLNLSGTMVYNTPSSLSANNTANTVSYYATNITTSASAVITQQLVANIAVPAYYMGNAISVYTPIAANVYYNIATTLANIAKSTSANVSVAVTGIYANIYQNGTQWGNVTLGSTNIYGNFTFTASSAANITTGNILQSNVYLTTGNVSFVPDYTNTTNYYTVKYYLTSTYSSYYSAVVPTITLNTPTTSGNINSSVTYGGAVGALTFTSNTYYTGGTTSSYAVNSSLGSDVNVYYLVTGSSYSLASYTNKIVNNLNNYTTTLTTTIPYIYAVNSNNQIVQTFTNNTDYSSNFVSSFLYYASQTYNSQNYNANVFLGNVNIPSTTLLKDASDNTSTIKFVANVNVAYSYTGYNINTLGTNGNISYLTYYSNPTTTTNSISGNISFFNYGTTTTLLQATAYPLSGNIQLNKSTLSINSSIANIVIYDGANNYIASIPSSYYTFTSTNTSGNIYTINYGNVAVNSNVYLKNVMGMINISNYSLPISYSSDMSYSFNVILSSNVVVPHTANINYYRYYANVSNSPNIGNVTYISGSATSNYVSYNIPITNRSPTTYGNVYMNKLYVASDVSFSNRLFVTNDVSLNGKLTVASDVSLNGKLTVASDVSLNGNLTMIGGSAGPYLYLTTSGGGGANSGIAMTTYTTRTGGPSAIINTTDDSNYSGPLVFSVAASGSIGANAATERMRISTSGYVGIGTTAPSNFLQIAGNSSTLASNAPDGGSYHNILLTSSKVATHSTNPSTYSMALGVDYTSGAGYINVAGNNAYQPVCLNTRGGNVGIGTTSPGYTLDVNGTVNATSYNATSDYRIKSNVIALSDTSYSVDLLRPVTYMNKSLGKQDIGFIAHEIQEQIPFLVTGEKDAEEHQTLNYTGLIGLLTKEIQDLKKEVKEIRAELASYKQ